MWGRAAALLYTAPAWVLLYQLALEKRRPGPWKLAATVLTLIGVLLLTGEARSGLIPAEGLLWGLASGAFYAATIHAAARLIAGLEPGSMAAGVQVWLLLGALVAAAVAPGEAAAMVSCLPAAVYLAVAVSHLSYVLFYRGLSGVEPHCASIAATLELVLSMAWGWLLFDESFTGSYAVGVTAITAAQLLAGRSQPTRRASQAR